MKIALLPADRGGCGLYRMIMPAHALLQEPELEIVFADSIYTHTDSDGNVIGLNGDPDMDVIVLQRVLDKRWVQTIPFLQEKGVAVVVDVDDDLQRTQPKNRAWQAIQPHLNPWTNWVQLLEACKRADMVTVSTPALKRYAPHGRVRVVPNFMPQSSLEIEREKRLPVLGWSGTTQTHPDDLESTRGTVGQIVNETGIDFLVVGDPEGVRTALSLPKEPLSTGWVPASQYMHELAGLDIGIVPLADNQFNQAKSALKGLEMAALGIPFVASPMPDYQRVCELGIGQLARNARQWRRLVTQLIINERRRIELGEQYKQAVAEHCLLESNVHLWAEAWTAARRTSSVGRASAS